MTDRPVLALLVGDIVRLKRRHPCGSQDWLVDRLGADIGLRCQGCGRHVLLDRRSLESRIAGFVTRGDPILSAALAPAAAPDSQAARVAPAPIPDAEAAEPEPAS
jgi:hypothetical protein